MVAKAVISDIAAGHADFSIKLDFDLETAWIPDHRGRNPSEP